MASISGSTSDKVYSIRKFLGLNEAPEGDTKLKLGEASVCRNWRVTREGNLQKRYGLTTILSLGSAPIKGVWSGNIGGDFKVLAACNDKLYQIYSAGTFEAVEIGELDCTNRVHMFGFSDKVYIMNGISYKEWDGETYKDVEGYIPIVVINLSPDGAANATGAELEGINKLSTKRRIWLDPDGTNKTFTIPEPAYTIEGIDHVLNRGTNQILPTTDYSYNQYTGKVTFSDAPPDGENTYEIQYSVKDEYNFYFQVAHMRFSELFSWTTNSRVVIYGDGTNEIFYSGMDYNSNPRADYFPDLNEIEVGEKNDPITSVIRHYSKLVVFKENSTWSVGYSSMTIEDGRVIPAYYVTALNKNIGNDAPGEVKLVMNSPRSVFGKDLYDWHSNTAYNGNLTADERQAKRISDRIYATLGSMNLRFSKCFNDTYNQEYYLSYNGTALVHNYAIDAWYTYDNFDAEEYFLINEDLYICTSEGKVKKLDRVAMNDDDEPINAYWESGSISYGSEWMRKYSSTMWVNMKPQTSSYVEISVGTDKKPEGNVKFIASGTGGFADWDFSSFDFTDNTMPGVKRLKLKAKKFTFYKLKLFNNKPDSVATVLSVNIKCRETGNVK